MRALDEPQASSIKILISVMAEEHDFSSVQTKVNAIGNDDFRNPINLLKEIIQLNFPTVINLRVNSLDPAHLVAVFIPEEQITHYCNVIRAIIQLQFFITLL